MIVSAGLLANSYLRIFRFVKVLEIKIYLSECDGNACQVYNEKR